MSTVRGFFVGVDRYRDPSITELSSATRDALALHALFSDNLPGSFELLRDEEATAASIRTALTALQTSEPDDVVVISYSGHGTSTHELVTHDADLDDLAGSCLPLDELTDQISQIPARQLICVLDCCFSGGAGAKVLNSPRRPRSAGLRSIAKQLEDLSGAGRLILTASAADEPAWEDGRLGHGLLTYALLEALQGAEAVRRGDRVPIYGLLAFVVDQVRSGAATHGARQTATLRGQIDGEITWPVFSKGPLYQERFPEFGAEPVTKDVIDTVLQVAQLKHPTADLAALSERLPVQLELGVPEPVVALARFAGQQLRRIDYLRLYAAGLAEPRRVLEADEADLLRLVDDDERRLRALVDAAGRAQDRADEVVDITNLLAPPETPGADSA